MDETGELHNYEWAINEWRNGRSAVRVRWDNTAECSVNPANGQLVNTSLLGERIDSMRSLDFEDIQAVDWRSMNSAQLDTLQDAAV